MGSIGIHREGTGSLAPINAAHDEEGALQLGLGHFQRHRLRRRNPATIEGLIGQEFQAPVRVDQATDRVPAQDQALALAVDVNIEPVGFTAGTAGNPGQVKHLHRTTPETAQIARELVGQTHFAKSVTPVKPAGS